MNRLLFGLMVAAFAFSAPVVAQQAQPNEQPAVTMPAAPGATATVTVPGTSVQTTGPVNSTTNIETGTIAGQVLLWVASAFGTTIGTVLTVWLVRLMKLAGIQGADLLRDKLQQIIINGLNAGAAAAANDLSGRGKIEVKNKIIADAVVYTQAHGAETMKALGLDPQSGAAVEAIKARIETAIVDPTTPTPAIMAPPVPVIPPGNNKTVQTFT